ncbi:MAG: hypothetical protein HKO82_03440 [Acidimicrobiia bacterium]|nr:hypothetical protein [Acidimicrobiia bacterium]NNL12726.1 hypothetical protein [Acidimicrobiia bacterium]RZV42781.1 MAG: hypothetical protein EX267_09195 [Acidimicrobiia bacterium]
MSVGHVARAIESAGIPTSSIYIRAFRHVAEEMKLSRAVVTRHPMGRPLGAAGDHARHRRVTIAALELFDSAAEPTLVELPEPFRASTRR